ncbi:MAG TPA: trypsin-like peptidase domain-containing protein [Candidatus Aquilonibacter sp.]|nr:trypsin-like peptidase domain-containing protein [Candidatus Aquilonibacter sp.]
MLQPNSGRNALRLLVIGLIIGLGSYWIGSRYGQHSSPTVEALRLPADTVAPTLDPTEAENVRIYRQAAPSVANIVTRAVEYDFFYGPVPTQGAGSGFLIDSDGHVLTNNHVVDGAQTIEVTFGGSDKTRYPAKFIGADTRNDIALLKINPGSHKFVPLVLGDSASLQVGQRVLAIGNPFGFQSTLTTGVVSALGRTVQTGDTTFIDQAIQTDAAINPGNSGGPLLNSHGEVIGIDSAISSPTESSAGIGFAIPINTARRVAEDLITEGHVVRATFGADGRALWPELANALNLPVDQGILIEHVDPNGPAAQAGIRGGTRTVMAGLQELRIGGDVLIAIDGTQITSASDLNLLLNRHQPGDVVTATIVRDGKQMNVQVKLGSG